MEKIPTNETIGEAVTLRKASNDDQLFLFNTVRTEMRTVYEASGQTVASDAAASEQFQKKFYD